MAARAWLASSRAWIGTFRELDLIRARELLPP
jgi:hypothetical protein